MNADHFPGVVAARKAGRVLADNAAASQLPQAAIDAVASYLTFDNAQKGAPFARPLHTRETVARARAAFADLFAVSETSIGFGANATSIAFGFARNIAHTIAAGDRVVVTASDHHANVTPWNWLHRFGAEIEVIGVDAHGDLDEAQFAAALANEPRLVALPWASNATGTVFDVASLSQRAHDAGALVVVDGVQMAPHRRVELPPTVDFAFFSAYKLFAPHFGVWYARETIVDRFFQNSDPFLTASDLNWSMETGTQSFEALAGWLGTVSYLHTLAPTLREAMDAVAAHERTLVRYALDGFAARADRITLYGGPTTRDRMPVFAFNLRDETPESVAHALNTAGIEARLGDYYAPRLMRVLAHDYDGTAVRLSFAHYNDTNDIDRCFSVLDSLIATAV